MLSRTFLTRLRINSWTDPKTTARLGLLLIVVGFSITGVLSEVTAGSSQMQVFSYSPEPSGCCSGPGLQNASSSGSPTTLRRSATSGCQCLPVIFDAKAKGTVSLKNAY